MNNLIHILSLAIISFIYVDYIAAMPLGIILSLIIFIIFTFISIKNLSMGIILSLFYAITTMEFPRDILDVYEALQASNEVYYNVVNTVKIGPFTLLVYLFFINTGLVLYKTHLHILYEKIFLIIFTTMLVIAFISTFFNILQYHTVFSIGMFVTNLKWFLFILMGYIQGFYLYKNNSVHILVKWFYLLPIFFGFRNLLFIVNDFINVTPKLDLMNQAYLSLIILIYIIVKGDWGIYKNIFYRVLLFISLLNFSRAFLLIFVLSVIISYFWKVHKKIRFNFSLTMNFIIIIGLMLFGLYMLNERLFDFLLWKLNVFDALFSSSGEMSGSGKIRGLELQNIWYVLSNDIYNVFFGKGFFATYDFSAYPLNNIGVIDLKSYSSDQLNSGVYYSTHSFSSAILLKYGVVGLIIYIFIPLYIAYIFYKNKQNLLLILIPIILIYSYYWRIEFAFLIGILFGILKTKEKNEV
jgi:hypothetical protein